MRRLLFAFNVLLLSCGPVRMGSDIENPPELRDPPPPMPFRVAYFMSKADKEYSHDDRQSHFEIGPRFWLEVEEHFGRAFREASAVPSPDRAGDVDFMILIEGLHAEARMDGWGGGDIRFEANFIVPRSGVDDRFHELVTIPMQPMDSGEVLRVTKLLSRAVVLQFLRKFRAKYGGGSVSSREPGRSDPARLSTDRPRGSGFYTIEDESGFNVLDAVVFDPKTGALSLAGHYDPAYAGPRIPYLQHLAALLENPEPGFTMEWASASNQSVPDFLEKTLNEPLAQQTGGKWSLTPWGRLVMNALGVRPTPTGGPAGWLGVETGLTGDAKIVVRSVKSGSPAATAGIKSGDLIDMAGNEQPVHPNHFDWLVGSAGAGARFKLWIIRGDKGFEVETVLGEAPGDPWDTIDGRTIVEKLLKAAGKDLEARVMHEWIVLVMSIQDQTAGMNATDRLLIVMDLYGRYVELQKKYKSGQITNAEASRALIRDICAGLDRIFGVPDNAAALAFDAGYRSGGLQKGIDAGFAEFGKHLTRLVDDASKDILARTGGIRLSPADFVAAYPNRFEVTTKCVGVDPTTLLARALFEADTTLKHIEHLTEKIAGYETFHAFIRSPRGRDVPRKKVRWRSWISIDSVETAQSTNGTTLKIGGAKMRINLRDQSRDDDPRASAGYDEMLTGLYDEFAKRFPSLHEIRECAKLSAAAKWLRSRKADLRLPKSGRSAYKLPDRVPGIFFVYVSDNKGGDPQYPWRGYPFAEGGVTLDTPDREVPTDASVVELRGDEVVKPMAWKNTEVERIMGEKREEPPVPRETNVARANRGWRMKREFDEALTVLTDAKGDPAELDHARRKLEEGKKLISALSAVETEINVLNKRDEDRQAGYERIEKSLVEARTEFKESAVNLLRHAVNDAYGDLKQRDANRLTGAGGAADPADLRAGLGQIVTKLDHIEKGLNSDDAKSRNEAYKALGDFALEVAKDDSALSKVLGPLSKVKDKAEMLIDVGHMGHSFYAMGSAAIELSKLDKATDEDLRRLSDTLMPIQNRLNGKIDAIRKDPLVKKFVD